MPQLPFTRIVLYKHGVGYFEREGKVEGDATLALTFKQAEVSDVLKSLIVLDLDGGHVASVSYDSTKPLEQLLADVALSLPEKGGLAGLLPQIKGARIAVSPPAGEAVEGMLLGLDSSRRTTADGVVDVVLVTLLGEDGRVRAFDLHDLASLRILDDAVRRDLDDYLRILLSAKKKDARGFAIFAKGEGTRTIRLGYTVEAPVWKATYRILLGEQDRPPTIQGWAVVDNMQDEDWEDVTLSLVSGLPVSFIHDLDTPRYLKRPVVAVRESTGVLPPVVEESLAYMDVEAVVAGGPAAPAAFGGERRARMKKAEMAMPAPRSAVSSTPAQVRERTLGDLFEYEIEHPVTIRRNQAALVPIVLRDFRGRSALLYNKETRPENPLRCVDFENTTGLTLEGGPLTVLEGGTYVGEAMLDTLKPDESRLIPFAVELGVRVLDNIESHDDHVSRIVIRNGMLRAEYGELRQTTYTVHNKSDAEQLLYLEHPREGGAWDLVATEKPHEVTESFWRFRLLLPPKRVTSFVVRQRRIQARGYVLAETRPDQLAAWVAQRYLDPGTERILGQVVELQGKAAEAERTIQQRNSERGAIHAEQQRIRENLKSLGDRSSEKELRERFVRTLNAQEDRLERIESEIAAHTAERDQARGKINELLGKLEYEADV